MRGWNVICDRCGREYRNHQLRQEWNGLRVCHGAGTINCWEPRNVQEFVRGTADRQTPPWVRPEPPDIIGVSRVWDDVAKAWVEP